MILNNKLFKLSSLCIIGTVAIAMNQMLSANAGLSTTSKNREANVSKTVESSSDNSVITDKKATSYKAVIKNDKVEVKDEETPTDAKPEEEKEEKKDFLEGPVKGINYNDYINYDKYKNLGIANIAQYLNVRKEPGLNGKIIGKMPPHAGCTILETEKDAEGNEWYKIKSDKVTGYVDKQYITAGDEALALVPQVGRLVVKVDCDVLNVRTKASTKSEVLYQISQGEELDIISISKEWIEVSVDVGQDNAFVAKEFVKVSFELQKAVEIEEILYGLSAERKALFDYAKKFLGNRYVYGGTSLTNGTDCSGFTMRIYEKFGHKLPRTSRNQANVGTKINESQLKPGDLVFYARGGRVYHVAMYAGNGKILHAANSRKGIIISNMKYTTPYRYVRILDD